MLKIGEFSTLTQVSVKTLRYYDEVGLLHPIHIDGDSGYRYYSAKQLPQLYRILALKDLGFSLEQVRKALDAGVPAAEIRGMFRLRMAEQQQHVKEEQDRLARVEARLRLIEREGDMKAEVLIKDVPARWFASVREVIPAYSAVGKLIGEVYGTMGPAVFQGVCAAFWHDKEYKESDVDAEAGVLLRTKPQPAGRVQVRELPPETVASYVHHGSYNRLQEAYDGIMRWVESNGYSLAGPAREMYLHAGQPVRQDDESYVTEIQVPVAKRE